MSLSTSLSKLVLEHQKEQALKKKELEALHEAASISVKTLTTDITSAAEKDPSFPRMTAALERQKQLEIATTNYIMQSKSLQKQIELWQDLSGKLSSSIKELGDVENWAQVIESDMSDIVSALSSTINPS
ncbi:hypothetical protein BB561_005484 [Smittium simulii]|uniref:Uncharacterized protein n=1 Tax=Smittium simulii TaxID=133385 RepID=A0A2T9YA81_9FUNG|nr:hypothetical protein BB561_005484 [Smittium simulii]